MKKMFSLVLALVMMLALATNAMAAKVTITSSNNDDATYNAYQILNLKTTVTCGNKEHDHVEDCYGYAYTVNAKYATAIKAVIEGNAAAKAAYDAAKAATNPSKTEDEAVFAALSAATGRAIADALYAQVKGMAADATLNQGTAEGLAQGYWLIVDSSVLTAEEGKEISKSLVMLDTAGQEDISIVAKDDSMILDKDVNGKEEEDTVDVGDTVTFTITSGAIPTKIAEYKTYTFIINDTMSKGLEYKEGTLVVKVGSTTLDSDDYTSVISDYNSATGTTIKIDLGRYILDNANATADQVVTVEYKAVLNQDAVMGSAGNENEATLTFTNDPVENQNGTTVPTEVKVYAAKITIDKHDGEDATVKLAGAQFKLYKEDAAGNKLYYSIDADGKDVSWDAEVATVMTTDANGAAVFSGLKAGTYYLEEVVAPEGYNLLADPVKVVINGEGTANAYANVTSAIANFTGTELPSTGGVGTTIFYTVGGVMMAAAFVLFITKKKMANEQ